MGIRYVINHLLLPFRKRRKDAFYCSQCALEIRGPLAGHGLPILRSALASAPAVPEDAADPNEHPSRKPYALIEQTLGYPIDAFFFVGDAIRMTQRRAADSKRGTGPLGARQLCVGLRDVATEHFGDQAEARATLQHWNVQRSEDVGRIVGLLMEAGIVRDSEVVPEREFAGMFTLENLFS